jgi:hypothetical protein
MMWSTLLKFSSIFEFQEYLNTKSENHPEMINVRNNKDHIITKHCFTYKKRNEVRGCWSLQRRQLCVNVMTIGRNMSE